MEGLPVVSMDGMIIMKEKLGREKDLEDIRLINEFRNSSQPKTLKISYLNCDFCTAKNHCAACGGELAEALIQKPGVESAEVNIPDHTLRVRHSLDADDLEDLLDGMGILVG